MIFHSHPDPIPKKKRGPECTDRHISGGDFKLGVGHRATQNMQTTHREGYITYYTGNSTVHKMFKQNSYLMPK